MDEAQRGREKGFEPDGAFRRFGDGLLGNLLGDSSAAIKRGQGLVTGVAQGTKEELVRMISAEVRAQLGDAVGLDVETDGRIVLAELDGQRQADIAEADQADADVAEVHRCLSWEMGKGAENPDAGRGCGGAAGLYVQAGAPAPPTPP